MIARVFGALFCSGSADSVGCLDAWVLDFSCAKQQTTESVAPLARSDRMVPDAKLRHRGLQGVGMTSCSCKCACLCE